MRSPLLLLGCLLLADCAGPYAAHPAPHDASDCVYQHGGGDGAFTGTNLDWTTEDHEYGEPVALYASNASSNPGRVDVTAPAGVQVSPAGARLAAHGVVRFTVRVERPVHGDLGVGFSLGGGALSASMTVPAIDGGDDDWHFVRPPDH